MKLIDELYELYRNKLTGDDEDIDILAFAVLEELDRDDVLHLINEMDDQELFDLMGLYLIESLKGKFAKEGIGRNRISPFQHRNLH
ncbi:hypothetical protein H1Z61_06920 [Bacillus aquiflavi]|uniref:Cytosolic protein n=1 Tax=Bacillus aquiflavi TaxID=2672567 RepID=A0A6B3W073_9BACI|nr:DUF6154 family protein [Bacillus aquiflavi]MBA4536879.1 hypothetical protein [Bacillus aquiflavi]NEY81246.1 hypothetical protein [Bacillus aquiflavi]UAC47638.1 DUF6154 family protein [Bacillus aquiflavi]